MSLNWFRNVRKWFTRRPGTPYRKHPLPREHKVRLALESLESRIAPAASINPGFEEVPDFTAWTVNTGVSPFTPNVSFTSENGSATVVRGPGAPQGNAYAHLSFSGDITNAGSAGYGTSIQSSNFAASGGEQISVTWRAAPNGDNAAPRGRLFDANTNAPVATFFDTTIAGMGSTNFAVANVFVPFGGSGNYYAVFEDGSQDSTNGNFIGATLDVDALGLTVQMSTTQENLYIRVDPNDSTNLQVWADGGFFVANFPNNSALPIQVLGDANNNNLIIDNSYGVVNSPVTFDGGGSPGAPGDSMLVVGTPLADTLTLTPTSTTTAGMSIDGSPLYSFSNIQNFAFYGGAGNDTMVVDTSASLLTTPIFYDGDNGYNFVEEGSFGGGLVNSDPPSQGNGLNTLVLTQPNSTTTQFEDIYSVGPNVGQGTDVITDLSDNSQTITFQNLAPVKDNVPSFFATVNATPAANAINYTQGPGGGIFSGPTGLVTIDNQESFEFSQKDDLQINAGAGSDEVNLNSSVVPFGSNGTASPGLGFIGVDGGDPTASDTLIDNVFSFSPSFLPQGSDSGLIIDLGHPEVGFSTTEHVTLNGQGNRDTLTYESPTNSPASSGNLLIFTPGATANSGTVTGRNLKNPGLGNVIVPLTFVNFQANTNLVFTNAAGVEGAPDRVDTLEVYGTAASDVFDVAPNGTSGNGDGRVGVSDKLNGNDRTVEIDTPGINVLSLFGLAGDDSFNVEGGEVSGNSTTFSLPYTDLNIDGGDPSASDIVNVTNPLAPVVVTPLEDPTTGVAEIEGYGPEMSLTGVEVVNLNLENAAATLSENLTTVGTPFNDTITYTPSPRSSGVSADGYGTFTQSTNGVNVNTVFNFANGTDLASGFTIVGGGGNADQVVIVGTAGRDQFRIDEGARTASVTDASGDTYQPVTLGGSAAFVEPDQETTPAEIQILTAKGLSGQDTFLVTPAPGIQFPANSLFAGEPANIDNLLVNVDGGASSSGENNALVIASTIGSTLPAADFIVVNRGADGTSGTVRPYGRPVTGGSQNVQYPDINYVNVQVVSPHVVGLAGFTPNLLIMGPDNFEGNDSPGNAAFIGSGSTLQIQHSTIFPNSTEFPNVLADQDYYRVVAQTTGTLDFQVYFKLFDPTLFPAGGNLALRVLDSAGNVLAHTAIPAVLGAVGTTSDARIRLPVVAGQSYYLHVYGSNADGTPNPLVVNGYDATIINTAAPVPTNLELSRSVPNGEPGAPLPPAGTPDTGDLPATASPDDTGRSQFDNVTKVNDPTIYVRLDDSFFLQDIPGNQTSGGLSWAGSTIPILFNASTTLIPTGTGNYRLALFDGGNGAPSAGVAHTLDPNDPTFLGFAQPVPGFPHLYALTIGTQGVDALADGLHNLTARVQILEPLNSANPVKTGFGDRSQPLQIIVDTVPPPVQFGTDNATGLVNDTGVPTEPETISDLATTNTRPTFQGLAEANSIDRLYVAITNPANPNFSATPVFPDNYVAIGLTVALPEDGTNAFPNGQWTLQSTIDLNDPRFFARDGVRTLVVTAEDLAGNVSTPDEGSTLQIFIDTQGPQITGVNISDPTNDTATGENTAFNLFALKPANQDQGPTPLVYGLTINVQDLPARFAPFLDLIAFKPEVVEGNNHSNGGITVIGDQTGYASFTVFANLDPGVSGQPATGEIQLRFIDANGNPLALPDDRFTLHINDTTIIDPAGNKLDGESNAVQPINVPTFPSGDGIPGGDFIARFTVNSRPSVGVFGLGQQQLDINGNGFWDLVNAKDHVNNDMAFNFGLYSDAIFAGNFSPTGVDANGFDKVGAYGKVNGTFRWLLTFADVASPSYSVVSGLQINGLPVAGKFNPGINADEIALFDGGTWYIDYNHTNNLSPSTSLVIHDGLTGFPIVGDFDGNGSIDLATYRPDINTFFFDMNPLGGGPRTFPTLTVTGNAFNAPGVLDRPVARDMNMDGVTDIGIFVPTSLDPSQNPSANWFFLVSKLPTVAPPPPPLEVAAALPFLVQLPTPGTISALNHPFNPSPFSNDLEYSFGSGFYAPLLGTWDPPLPAASSLAPVVKLVSGTYTDVAVQAQVDNIPAGSSAGLISRLGGNGPKDEYWAGLVRTGNSYSAQIKKFVGGTWTVLASQATTFTSGILRLEAVGASLRLLVNGQAVVAGTDGAIPGAGAVGSSIGSGSVEQLPTAAILTRSTVLPTGPTGSLTHDTPTFNWPPMAGGVQNSLIVVDNTTGQVVINANVAGLSFTPSAPLPRGHAYTWYIVSKSSSGVPSYSTSRTFSITGLIAPTPAGPSGTIAASTGYDMPTFSWNDTGVSHYALVVYDVTTAQKKIVVNNPNVSSTSFTLGSTQALTPGHKYVWYVGSVSSTGTILYSSARTFTLAKLVVAPASGLLAGTINTTLPTFTWPSVAGASYYALVLVDVTAYNQVVANVKVGGTSYTPAKPLKKGHSYAWRYGAVSTNGTLVWSSVKTFHIA